jgi:hypothetical protein
MKKVFFALSIALVVGLSTSLASATPIIADWTFETTSGSITGTSATIGPIAADSGSGSASGSHASSSNVWSSPAGNGSAHSMSSNIWAVGDYLQFQVSTVGDTGIGFQWDMTSSNTGPGKIGLYVSTDGSTFTQVGADYSVTANASPNPTWSSNPLNYASIYTNFVDLSTMPSLDNQATVYFRLEDDATTSANGGTVASGGSFRADNVIVTSPATQTAVPEPSAIVLGGLALLSLVGAARFRKKA